MLNLSPGTSYLAENQPFDLDQEKQLTLGRMVVGNVDSPGLPQAPPARHQASVKAERRTGHFLSSACLWSLVVFWPS